ncbi:MAG: 2-amino-4-hydroxy-6-hydroxymethyldihydropteridine diphosphokinase [Planctomycetaceae bacterium]|nr:2-amino-4-hydroxy-6-hydroxymethyldihydropteridine diphosphokinase [Planctomycetaceae bacterium]
MECCWIGLGGNLGDVPHTFATVAAELHRHPEVRDVRSSPLYRSAPMGIHAGDEFWNAVVGCATSLTPHTLLDLLQQLETRHGRVRGLRWGPRPLDLDLIAFGGQRLRSPRLQVPHPGRIYRRFVLDPLCDLSPDWIDPEHQITAAALRRRLVQTPRQLALCGEWDPQSVAAIEKQVERRWPDIVCGRDLPAANHGLVITPDESAGVGLPAVVVPREITGEGVVQFVLDAATAAFEPPVRML